VLRGGWRVSDQPQAVLMGGYGGTWLPWSTAAGLLLDERVLNASGHSLGAGVLALLPQHACGIAEASRVADFLARSSARQCGPCLFGLPAIGGVLAELRAGRARRSDLARLQRWAGEVHGRGACHHPDGAVRMALSVLTTFATDVEAHRRRRPCAAAASSRVMPVPDGAP
jgi:NADH:ubiquinone oxidoreductase subunit F (NADH-binding)